MARKRSDPVISWSPHRHRDVAMHADANAAPGTVIGKALERLKVGDGTIRTLVLFR